MQGKKTHGKMLYTCNFKEIVGLFALLGTRAGPVHGMGRPYRGGGGGGCP